MKIEINKRLRVNTKRIAAVANIAVRRAVKTKQIETIAKQLQLITEAYFYDPVIKRHIPRDIDHRSGLLFLNDSINIGQRLDRAGIVGPSYIRPSFDQSNGIKPHTASSLFGAMAREVESKGLRFTDGYGNAGVTVLHLPSSRLLPADMEMFWSARMAAEALDDKKQLIPQDFITKYNYEADKFNKLRDKAVEIYSTVNSLMLAYSTIVDLVAAWPEGEDMIRQALIDEGQLASRAEANKALTTNQSIDKLKALMGN